MVTALVTMTRVEAEALTARLRTAAGEFFGLLEAAFQGGVHTAMGYRTFRAYLNAEFPGFTPPRIDRAARNAVIRGLLDAGMSTPDAAAITGVNQSTASRARQEPMQTHTPQGSKVLLEPPAAPESRGISKVARSLEFSRRRVESGVTLAEVQVSRAIESLQAILEHDDIRQNYLQLMHALIELSSCVKAPV